MATACRQFDSRRRIADLDRPRAVLYDARFSAGSRTTPGIRWGIMARICEICGKKTVFGHNVSHAHNVTNRIWRPNLQRVRIRTEKGATRRIRICTRCLRSNKVEKAVS